MHRIKMLDALCSKWSDCSRCQLHQMRKQVVNWRGSPGAKLALIGEGPGADEDKLGIPFVGAAGRRLDQLLIEAGLKPEKDVFVANIVGCRPPNNREPSIEEAKACRDRLTALLAIVMPKVLLLMGGTAAKRLAGIQAISKWRGEVTDVVLLADHGAVFEFTAIPTFHPSYLNRMGGKESIKSQMLSDIKKAWEVANGN